MSTSDLRVLSAALAVSLFALAAPAGAQGPAQSPTMVDPFGPEAATLSKDDNKLMRQTIDKVLAEKRAGATGDWKGDKIGGRATLRKTFTRNGMACGEVVHEFTVGRGRRYVLPFCETKPGEWKIAY
jgi:hypothetical protein